MKKRVLVAIVATATAAMLSSIVYAVKKKPAEPLLRVAVIDTGYRLKELGRGHLCDTGHKDFTGEGVFNDEIGHGSNIVALIEQYAGQSDYCVVVIKAFYNDGVGSAELTTKALQYASTLNIDVLNLSFGGRERSAPEQAAVIRLLNKRVAVIAAAGNDKHQLDIACNYYPACFDPRVLVVGCKECDFANRGRAIDIYEDGLERSGGGVVMSGTSQATAVASGKMVMTLNHWYMRYNNGKNRRKKLID